MNNRLTLVVLGTFTTILLISGGLAYVLRHQTQLDNAAVTSDAGVGAGATTRSSPSPQAQKGDGGRTIFGDLFGQDNPDVHPATSGGWKSTSATVALRFSLAALLAAILAFRPRRGVAHSRRNPYVGQTQILMAVVAAAMMMVVGDSAARAFGIFAAASLVRFRTNIRDPKEITVLLVCLGVGLAAGVGRWDMAIILSLFVMLSLAILEWFEQSQVFRSMEISVATKNAESTHEVLKRLFKRYRFDMELRELNRPDEDKPMGKIVYVVNMKANISTDRLSEEILAADRDNIDSVEWEQKDSQTYIYK
ncbi:MAG TPA: DUF4956 domain-containing protein [Pyrinomonadaceae bacterium]|nr:DUF4956 domain-containing protein [Pyrinomonadaceae bacterium]